MVARYDGFYTGAQAAESAGNANAVNPVSGASGLYQFMPDTWAGVVRNYGQRYGIRPDGIMDPAQQELAIRAITENEYAPVVQRAGREARPEELYSVHLFGGPTYTRLATADPSAPASEALAGNRVSWNAIHAANRGVFGGDPNISAGEALQRVQAYYTRKATGSPRKAVSPRQVVVSKPSPAPGPAPASTPTPTDQGSWISRLISTLTRILFRPSKIHN